MLKISHSIENNNNCHVVANQTEPYIIFTVDNEEIGVEAQKVLELMKYMAPLKMPNNFTNVNGMAIYRGRMIPIIDLRLIFGLEPISYDDNTVTIIVESGVGVVGITAERVLDLFFVPLTAIKKVNAINFVEKTKYLKSVANFSGRLVLLLDLEKMIETKTAQSVFEGPVKSESLIESENQIVFPEKTEEEPRQSSSPLIDPKELEDLLNGLLPVPEQEFEDTQLEPVVEIEPPKPGGETEFPETASPKDGILKPEEIAEALSSLESSLAVDLPEDLLQIETTAAIQMEPAQGEEQLTNEVFEEIIKELEARTKPVTNGQFSENDRKSES